MCGEPSVPGSASTSLTTRSVPTAAPPRRTEEVAPPAGPPALVAVVVTSGAGARLTLNGRTVAILSTVESGPPPVERAAAAARRLQAFLAAGGYAADIQARPLAGGAGIYAGATLLVAVTAAEAQAQRQGAETVAAAWAQALRSALTLPPVEPIALRSEGGRPPASPDALPETSPPSRRASLSVFVVAPVPNGARLTLNGQIVAALFTANRGLAPGDRAAAAAQKLQAFLAAGGRPEQIRSRPLAEGAGLYAGNVLALVATYPEGEAQRRPPRALADRWAQGVRFALAAPKMAPAAGGVVSAKLTIREGEAPAEPGRSTLGVTTGPPTGSAGASPSRNTDPPRVTDVSAQEAPRPSPRPREPRPEERQPPEPAAAPAPAPAVTGSPFRTFTLPRPRPARPADSAPTPPPALRALTGSHAVLPTRSLSLTTVVRLFPGDTRFSFGLGGQLGADRFDSSVSYSRLMDRGGLDSSYVQWERAGLRARLGDTQTELLGAARGLRLAYPASRRIDLGLGFYERDRIRGGTLVAADARWSPARGLTSAALVGLDGTWRTTQSAERGPFSISTFAGRDADSRESATGAYAQVRLAPPVALYGRWDQRNRIAPSSTSALGLRFRLGRPVLYLEQARHERERESQPESLLGVLVPGRRLQVMAGWHRFGSTSVSPATSELSGSLTYLARSRTTLWLSHTAHRDADEDYAGATTLGFSHTFSPRWALAAQAELGPLGTRLRAALDWQARDDLRLTLLVAPDFSAATAVRHRIGLQIARTLSLDMGRTGAIRGHVLLDGRPYTEPVGVTLDGRVRVVTDPRGEFEFRRVPAGPRRLALDLSTLAAGLAPVDPENEVMVSTGRRIEVELPVERRGSLRGRVVDLSSPPPPMPEEVLNGVVITLGDDRQTATGRDGGFSFSGMKSGTWVVRIEPTSLPPGYEIRGPVRQEITILPGEVVPEIEFTIARRPREVKMFVAPPASGGR